LRRIAHCCGACLTYLDVMTIKKIWIDEGCISCNLCEDLCPDVFEVPAGGTSTVLDAWKKCVNTHEDLIREAADSCPVEVIKIDE
jgi:ferredoxin